MIAADDVIAAVASPAGHAARGIVRLSGSGTHPILGRLLERGIAGRESIALDGGVRLPVSVLRFSAPRSYTGQDGAEILTVGNPAVLDRVLGRLLESGARRAEPGEFSARAYLAGKLTLAQAESIGVRIAADRDADLAAAERVRTGAFGERCAGWAARLADLLGLVEAGIDFTDQEDVVAIEPAALREGLVSLRGAIGEALGPGAAGESGSGTPLAVLVGPPNAGKSTLFNALLGRARSVVSDEAGTTRDAIEEELVCPDGGSVVRLCDLPGLDRAVEGETLDGAGQRAAREAIERADLLIACDPAGRFAEAEGVGGRPVLRVRTKADLAGLSGHGGQTGASGGLAVCALDGWRLEALRRAIADAAERGGGGDAVVPRHRRALRAAVTAMDEAIAGIGPESGSGGGGLDEPEMAAVCMRAALDEIGSVSGQVTSDEVLGRVFAAFCVGK